MVFSTSRKLLWNIPGDLQVDGCQSSIEAVTTHSENNIVPTVPTVPTVTISPSNKVPHTNVLLGLSGDQEGFFMEVEVVLKSILMNAPTDGLMTIHILADEQAFIRLEVLLKKIDLTLWRSRHQIVVRTYDVSSYQEQWKDKVRNLYKADNASHGQSIARHTIGTWYRLFAVDILPPDVGNVIYMDPDVVVLSNLQEIWKYVDQDKWFNWGPTRCAGFLVLNVPKTEEIWQAVRDYGVSKVKDRFTADQVLFRIVNQTRPEHVGMLPKAYDFALSDGMYRHKSSLLKVRPKLAYIHMNGGGDSKAAWFGTLENVTSFWVNGNGPAKHQVQSTYGLSGYYIKVPWEWARFFVQSTIPEGEGYDLILEHAWLNNTVVKR